MKNVKINSIIRDKHNISQKKYGDESQIEGIRIISLKDIISEKNIFGEIIRLKNGIIEAIPHFRVAQINRVCLLPGTIKAWHLHFIQDEIWYVNLSDHLIVGLWDIRKHSVTLGAIARFAMGAGTSQLLYIPRGVAHGSLVIIDKPVELYVFVNKQFNINDPDEKRIPWNSLGDLFWMPQ